MQLIMNHCRKRSKYCGYEIVNSQLVKNQKKVMLEDPGQNVNSSDVR